MLTNIKAHFAYYGLAALHTFWQAAVAAILSSNIGSMLGAGQLPQVSEAEKLGISAAVAGGAAVLSYIKQLLVLVPPASEPAVEVDPVTNGTASAG